ncbi:hypothetical protein AGMMS50239_16050 [Bacteroidia bacterium]|nr:hypothetical protein AGMMS50239_16050 [Bacteroidia bacterium]
MGYGNIPEYWMKNLKLVEDRDFAYTTISLNKAYQMEFRQVEKTKSGTTNNHKPSMKMSG